MEHRDSKYWKWFDAMFDVLPQCPSATECSEGGLGRDMTLEQNTASIIELTLNYPRVVKFQRLTDKEAESFYHGLYIYIMERAKLRQYIIKETITYEKCKSGFTHLHAQIYFKFDRVIAEEGLVQSIVREWLTQLPKRYGKYDERCFFRTFCRYRDPSICCQYRQPTDSERACVWDNYIKKNM